MSNKSFRSNTTKSKSRFAAVLELAEILNVESGGNCQKADENTALLKEILSTLKDIKEILQQGTTQNKFPTSVERTDIRISNEESNYGFHEDASDIEIAICTSKDISMEYTEEEGCVVEEEETDDHQEDLIDFPLKTVADVNWIEKEIANVHSPYRKKIINLMRIRQTDTHDYKSSTRSFLKIVFDDALLNKYNWKGLNGKHALSNLKNLLIFLRKLLGTWYPKTEMTNFIKVIQNYLKNLMPKLRKAHEEQILS